MVSLGQRSVSLWRYHDQRRQLMHGDTYIKGVQPVARLFLELPQDAILMFYRHSPRLPSTTVDREITAQVASPS